MWKIPLQFPHYIPLFEKGSTGLFRTLVDETVRSSRGLDLPRVCPQCRPSNRRIIPFHVHRDLGQRAEMRPVVSERYGRFPSRLEEFRGRRAPSAGMSGGWSSRCVGGSAATPTQCGLIATGRMPIDRSSTAWPNSYWRTSIAIVCSTPETLRPGPSSGVASCLRCRSETSGCVHPPALPVEAKPRVVGCFLAARSAVCDLGFFVGSKAIPQGELRRERQ